MYICDISLNSTENGKHLEVYRENQNTHFVYNVFPNILTFMR